MSSIRVENVSRTTRAGVKGPGSAAWLADLGLPVPAAPNTWQPTQGGLIARLGLSEFLIEGPEAAKLAAPCAPGIYPVLRQDLALVLRGTQLHDLLLEMCAVNFRALSLAARPVVLTSMVSVGVTVIPGELEGVPCYRLWCDASYGEWFLDTLTAVANELPEYGTGQGRGQRMATEDDVSTDGGGQHESR
jgi:sarcosine oxidase subunit gamma